MSILEELKWRGLVADCTDAAELEKKISSPITLYCGFDPTADSLHVGNLVPLLALRRFQEIGSHYPIAVAGGATGSIGDPSGKTQERQLLTKEILDRNIASVKVQLTKLLDFETKKNPARLVDNASWTQNISFLDFLRDIGKHFSVNQMMQKESVQSRMETGISYTEFSYMLLQAYDFYYLADPRNKDENGKPFNCELQIGGSDQWGNITAGIDLIRKKLLTHLFVPKVFGLTLPLITNADGTKFGKTEAGAIWLDPKRTSEYRFYQFWVNTDDRDVIRYLKYFTLLTREEIADLETKHIQNPGAREAHKVLANAVTSLIHGKETADLIQRISDLLFGTLRASIHGGAEDSQSNDLLSLLRGSVPTTTSLSAKHLLDMIAEDLPHHEILTNDLYLKGIPIVELLVASNLCSSKGQARKDIEGGGIYINNLRVTSLQRVVTREDLVHTHILLRKGKKNYVVVTAK